MSRIRVAIFATHPIQYHIPWYRELSTIDHLDVKVFYGAQPEPKLQGAGFAIPFTWDIPLLDGYESWVSTRSNSQWLRQHLFWLHARDIGETIRDWRPNIAIITGWNSIYLFQTLLACRNNGVPVIVRGEVNGLKHRSGLIKTYHRSLFNRFDAFLSIGLRNKEYYLNHGISKQKVFSTPYFIDNNRFKEMSDRYRENREAIRRIWRINNDDFCFLFVGKLIRKKRILDFLRAFRLVMNDHGNQLRILIVGTGQQLREAKNYIKVKQLPVSFAGFLNQTEIGKAYAASDTIVLPSDARETWGLAVNEAMASGLPALVSDQVGCGPDLVIQGRTGDIFQTGNIEDLKTKMIAFCSNRKNTRTLGINAQRHVFNNYSSGHTVQGTLAAISSLQPMYAH